MFYNTCTKKALYYYLTTCAINKCCENEGTWPKTKHTTLKNPSKNSESVRYQYNSA